MSGDVSPDCTTATAKAPSLGVHPRFVRLPEAPFGIVSSPGGTSALVDLLGPGLRPGTSGVGVVSLRGAARLRRTIVLSGEPLGSSLTANGLDLLVADGSGAAVLSVARAQRGAARAVLGTLAAPTGGGATEVTSSRDGRYAFVSLEDSARIAVFRLARGFGHSAYVGSIPTGIAPVGLALSPDGRWLYSTSERTEGARGRSGMGTLSVIDVARAERDPARGVVARALAGCSPVRVIVTSVGGGTVWVTARESDSLLGFSAARLRSDPGRALEADVRVGEAPVGLASVDSGRRIVVAASNRFGPSGAPASLDVVDPSAALAGRPALVGSIPAGTFPREMALVESGRDLLIGDFGSDELEIVPVTGAGF